MKAKDIKLASDDDLLIDNTGDFSVDLSDQQSIDLLLTTNIGECREAKMSGVGIQKYVNAPMNALSRLAFRRNVKLQLDADGYTDVKLIIDNNMNISIDAQRPEQ